MASTATFVSVVSVSPFRCRMWALHDRLESAIDEDTCKTEIESFLRHGQLVPALGRPLRGDPNHDVELIYGARRHFVAQHLNKPLLVEVREVSDMEAIVAMDIENRQRKDISPYEQGLSYIRCLRAKYFSSQDEMARTLKVSPSQVSRLIKLARLPTVIVGAFGCPTLICEEWGLKLMEAWDDEAKRPALADKARKVATQISRSPAREVYAQLIASTAQGRALRPRSRDQVVTSVTGQPLFRIRHQSKYIALLLPIECVSAPTLGEIRCSVAEIMHRVLKLSDPPCAVLSSADPLLTRTPTLDPTDVGFVRDAQAN